MSGVWWINRNFKGRNGWRVSHVLLAESEHTFRGAVFAKTACGLTVRADAVIAAGSEGRCSRCAAVAS